MKREKEFWSERRRKYIFGVHNVSLGYPETMKGWLMVVCEKTLGYSKESDKISLSQFQEILGPISVSQLKRIKAYAKKCNLVLVKSGRGREIISEYSPQEDQSKWIEYPKRRTSNVSPFRGFKRAKRGSSNENPFNSPERAEKGSFEHTKGVIEEHKRGHLDTEKGSSKGSPTAITPITVFTGKGKKDPYLQFAQDIFNKAVETGFKCNGKYKPSYGTCFDAARRLIEGIQLSTEWDNCEWLNGMDIPREVEITEDDLMEF